MSTKHKPMISSNSAQQTRVSTYMRKLATRNNLYIVIAFVLGSILSAGIYFFISHQTTCSQYEYINSDFACGNTSVVSKSGYVVLQDNINQYIQQQYAAGTATTIAVYFRDLVGGPNFGVNEDETFIPASLLKLPVMMSIFTREEQQSGFVKTQLDYSTSSIAVSIPQGIDTPVVSGMQWGKSYTLEDLMASTIINSDNLAYYLLIGYMNTDVVGGAQSINSALQQLGIIDPQNDNQQSVSVTQYASLFRLLYNVSFLSPQHSEELLSWLSRSTFNDGLRAGVPQSVTVADKWGLRSLSDGSQELHDCGIVYYPQNPYILCVMTMGTNQAQLASVIAGISKMTYQEFDSRNNQQ